MDLDVVQAQHTTVREQHDRPPITPIAHGQGESYNRAVLELNRHHVLAGCLDVQIRVKLFALAKQIAGSEVVELSVPAPARVQDVRSELARAFPSLAGLVPQMLIAVDSVYAADSAAVLEKSEVACIPPVSGG